MAEGGRILSNDVLRTICVVELDTGEQYRFSARAFSLSAGRRVLVTRDRGRIHVALDLSPIGMVEQEALDLDRVRARFDAMIEAGPLTAQQRELFDAVFELHPYDSLSKKARELRDRFERGAAGDHLPISDDDPWAASARGDLAKLAQRDAWIALLALAGDGAKPTKKWLKAAAELVAKIGAPAFVATVRRWFELVAAKPVVRDEDNWFTPAMADVNGNALRNLVWACSTVTGERETETLAVIVGDLAVRCFTKIPGVGALSTRAGNACIYVLSQLPGLRAVAQLSRLGTRLRYKQAIALVDKAKLECAKRAGMEPIDLEELALPTFGLDVTGRARIAVGDYTAELAIAGPNGDEVTLTWFGGAKKLKSAPAALKTTHAEELKELKTTHKELAALVPTLRYRLERWMIEPREWTLADLRTRYLDHPLAAPLARRLIYTTGERAMIFVDGYPLGVNGKQLDLPDDTKLALWHPLG
ncbi:MAG TPA: DUF4132 domain-containing protein, partial [Kofleriaceae bacterium]|nr:DUF4132 domain-containing protein [Kofleriaceae bacterium]